MCKNHRGIRIKSGLSNRSKAIDPSTSSLNFLCRSSSSPSPLNPSSSSSINCDHSNHRHHSTKSLNNWNTIKSSDYCDQVNCDSFPFTSYLSIIKSTFANQSTLNYRHYGLITFLSICLYLNTINADFAYDDSRAIKSNHDLNPSTPWTNLFFNDFWGTPLVHSGSHKSYRPLTVLSFRLNYYFNELSPAGYHGVNVILYSLVCLLFAHLTTYLFQAGDTHSCLISSLIFTSHPIHTESVAGIVGRADLLATLFFIISLISYIRYCHLKDLTVSHLQPHPQRVTPYVYLYTSLMTAAWSMLSKEYGITVLGVSALYHIAVHHHLTTHRSLRITKKLLTQAKYSGLREGLTHLVASAIILLTFRLYMMGLSAPNFSPADNPAAESPFWLTRTLTFSYLPCFNFGLLLYPRLLSFDWSMESIPLIKGFNDPRNLISVTFYSILIFISYRMYKFQSNNFLSPSNDEPSGEPISSSLINNSSHSLPSILQHENDVNYNHSTNYSLMNLKGYKMRSTKHQNLFNDSWLSPKPSDHSDWSSSSSTSSSSSLSNVSSHLKTSVPTPLNPSFIDNHSMDFLPSHVHSISMNTLSMAWSLLVIPFLPATNGLFYVGFVIAERILIIPSMGYSLIITLGFNFIYHSMHPKSSTIKSNQLRTQPGNRIKLLYILLISLLTVFSVRTINRNEDWKSEEHLYRSGIPINPPKAYGNLANILSNKGRKVEAEMAYRKALTFRSNMADVHYNLGILLQDQGRYHEALQSYTNAIKFRPRLALAYLNMGLVLTKLGRKTEAMKVYQHCTRLDGTGLKDPKTHEATRISAFFNLGQLYSDEGSYEEAIKVFTDAIKRMPAHYQPQSLFNMLGEAYYKLGKYEEAESWYKKALLTKGDHIPAHLTYAKLLAKWGRPEEAIKWFLKAQMLAPNDSSVYQHYGQFLSEHGKHEEAANCLLKATRLSPNDYEIVFAAANVLRTAGRNQEAERYYKEAVRLRPNEVTSHMNLGAMLHVNGKLTEAEESYLTALKLKPDDQLTQTNLAKLRHLITSRRTIGR